MIKSELHTITKYPVPSMDDWVFTVENHPFINLDISALDAKRLSVEEVRSLLSIPEEDHEPDEKGMDDYKNIITITRNMRVIFSISLTNINNNHFQSSEILLKIFRHLENQYKRARDLSNY